MIDTDIFICSFIIFVIFVCNLFGLLETYLNFKKNKNSIDKKNLK